MDIVELIKEDISKIAKNDNSIAYLANNISEKNLNNTIKYIAENSSPEFIIGVVDTTAFKSSKEGIAFLGSCMYIKQMLVKPILIPYSNVTSVFYDENMIVNSKGKSKSKYEMTIEVNGETINIGSAFLSMINGQELYNFFIKIIDLNDDSFSEGIEYKNQDQCKPLESMDSEVKISYVKLLINYIFEEYNEIESKHYSELMSFIVKINIDPEDRIELRGYMLNEDEIESTADLLATISESLSSEDVKIIKQSLVKDLLILYKIDNNLSQWKENETLLKLTSFLEVSNPEVQEIVEIIKHDDDIISKRLDDTQIKKSVKDISAKAIAVGVPMAALYFSGSVVGVSAAGMTSGLAALGMGGILGFSSMFTGVGALALIGIGSYQGIKKVTGMKDVENNKQRERILQEIIRNSQKTLNILIEDMNTVSNLLVQELGKGKETEIKIEKLVGIVGMLSKGAGELGKKINFAETESIITRIPKKINNDRLIELTNQPILKEAQDFVLSCYSEGNSELAKHITLEECQKLYDILQRIGYLNLKDASIASVKSSAKNMFKGISGK